MIKQIAVVALALSLSSCENLTPPKDTKTGAAEQAQGMLKIGGQAEAGKPSSPTQRFAPLPETNGAGAFLWGVPRPFLALDTMTGQLCKTWGFRYDLTDDRATDAQKLMSQMPECSELYRETSEPTVGSVKMRAPDGTVKLVPSEQVEHYKSLGATVVK